MRVLITILMLFSTLLSYAEDDFADILEKYSGKQKYEKMLAIADSIYDMNDSAAYNFVKMSLEYADKNNDTELLMKARHVYGNIYYHYGNNRKAAEEYKNSIIAAEKLQDREYLYENFKQLGGVFYYLSDYKTATIFFYKAGDLAQTMGDELKNAEILNELGVVYDELKDYDKAEEFYNNALLVYQKNNRMKEVARTYNNIATTKFNRGEYDIALSTFEKALNIYRSEKDEPKIAIILNNMASIQIEKGNYDKAVKYLNESTKAFSQYSDNFGIALNDHNFGKVYFLKNNFALSLKHLNKSLASAVEMEVPTLIRDNYYYKSKVDSAKGDFRSAFLNMKNYKNYEDALSSDRKQKEIQEITSKYELAQKEKQNFSLIRDNEIKRLQLEKQRNINNYLIILFILIVAISYFIHRSYMLKSRNEELLKTYSEEIESLNKKLVEEVERTKKELNESNEKLRLSEKESARMDKLVTLGTMVAGITHEIKNPTQVIKLSMDNIRLCMNDLALFIYDLINLSKDKHSGVEDIKNLVEKHRVTKLFSDIKNLIVSNKKSVELIDQIVSSTSKITYFNKETKDNLINEIINDVMVIMKNSVKYVASVELELDPSMEPFKCNYQEISQIIINLISNARDAVREKELDPGEGMIKVRSGKESGKVFIEVSDNGAGMSPEQIEKAFEAFYTTKESGTGQGLGLSIVKNIVDIYGGFIQVKSEKGGGTVFTIYFPVKEETDSVLTNGGSPNA